MTSHDPDQVRFDQVMRALHADAVANLSAGTTAQLHRRRHAALSAAPARGSRWRLPAAAFASLLVVAVGLGFGLQSFREAPPQAAAPAVATAAPDTGIEAVLDDFDQSPDFYAWLASGDADLIAME